MNEFEKWLAEGMARRTSGPVKSPAVCILAKENTMKFTLRELVEKFDSDEGLPEWVYIYVRDEIKDHLGEKAAQRFGDLIDATDGKFYLKADVISAWSMILIAAAPPEWAEETDDSGQVVLYTGHDAMGREVED